MAKIYDIEIYLPPKKITNEELSILFPKWKPEKIIVDIIPYLRNAH